MEYAVKTSEETTRVSCFPISRRKTGNKRRNDAEPAAYRRVNDDGKINHSLMYFIFQIFMLYDVITYKLVNLRTSLYQLMEEPLFRTIKIH